VDKLETMEAIKIMDAYCDGKEIEANYGSGWVSINDPAWQFGDFKYRIKRKPKVIYVNEYSPGYAHYDTFAEAIANAHKNCTRIGVKYIEVIE